MRYDDAFNQPSPPPRQITRESHARWHRLLTEQHGVLSRRQAIVLGVTPQGIRAQVTANRWRRVLHGVYATFTGPLPRPARLSAALLYAGPPAMLSHRTAAEEWGMLETRAGPVHITVPYSRNAVSNPPAVILHRSRAFRYIASADTPLPKTSRADTIIDLATTTPSADEARRCFTDLVSRTAVSTRSLARQLERRPPFRHRAAIHAAFESVRGGALSALESEYATCVEFAHGLPEGARQMPFEVDGRLLWEDVMYDAWGADLSIRLDGRGFHATPGVAFRDRRRDNAAELAGRHRLMYGWAEVADDPCGVAAEVVTVLRRCGWRGTVRSCARPRCAVQEFVRSAS